MQFFLYLNVFAMNLRSEYLAEVKRFQSCGYPDAGIPLLV